MARKIYPWGRTPIIIDWEAVRASEPVWMFWRREKSRTPTGTRTPDRPALAQSPFTSTMFAIHVYCFWYRLERKWRQVKKVK